MLGKKRASLVAQSVKNLPAMMFNLHAEYIMRNAGLDEAQTGIKIAGMDLTEAEDIKKRW